MQFHLNYMFLPIFSAGSPVDWSSLYCARFFCAALLLIMLILLYKSFLVAASLTLALQHDIIGVGFLLACRQRRPLNCIGLE